MEKAPSNTGTVVQTKINLVKIDDAQVFNSVVLIGINAGMHPLSVVKTRMQVATKGMVDKSAYSGLRGLLRTQGIPGLYRGFGTAITGSLPSHVISIAAYETATVAAYKMVEPLKLSDYTKVVIADGIAGMTGFLCSKGASVPFEVISQRLMVQGYSGHASYNGGLDVARKVVKQHGIRGLYRGFVPSFMISPPIVLVTCYHPSLRVIWSLLGYGTDRKRSIPSQGTVILAQSAAVIFAAAAESCIMTPLDTIKTRLQVMGHDKRPSTRQVIKTLIADEGWKGFYRGIGPRFFNMVGWGGVYAILFSEQLKISKARARKSGKDSQETIHHGSGRSG